MGGGGEQLSKQSGQFVHDPKVFKTKFTYICRKTTGLIKGVGTQGNVELFCISCLKYFTIKKIMKEKRLKRCTPKY